MVVVKPTIDDLKQVVLEDNFIILVIVGIFNSLEINENEKNVYLDLIYEVKDILDI